MHRLSMTGVFINHIGRMKLVTTRGLMEFDDVLHNIIGAIIGVTIVIVARAGKTMCKQVS